MLAFLNWRRQALLKKRRLDTYFRRDGYLRWGNFRGSTCEGFCPSRIYGSCHIHYAGEVNIPWPLG
jgi:hypothetical protein